MLMKKIFYLFMALFAISATFVSCSSDDDDSNGGVTDNGKEFRCTAMYKHATLGTNPYDCQFFFFPKGNYVKVERKATNYETSLSWEAYAITASGEKVASIMQADYQQTEEYVIPHAVNGYKGSTTEGTFYVVAIPYRIHAEGNHEYLVYNCYKAKEFTKKASEVCSVIPIFDYGEVSDYAWFDGESSEPTNLGGF